MMATSIVGTLPPLSINSTWRTPSFLSSGPRHRILDSYYGNYDLDCFSRIPKTQEGKMASQWTNVKAAKLIGIPASKDKDFMQDGEVVTTIRFLEFKFEVPLDHSDTSAKPRTLFLHAKLVYDYFDKDKPNRPEIRSKWREIVQKRDNSDLLLYLCGGPGDGNDLKNPELKKAALKSGYHVLFVDYRGTGQSSAITTAPKKTNPQDQEGAKYFAMFRQDNIVRDLEAIRLCLDKEMLPGPEPELELQFSLLGQSFGGWIILTYLSFLPKSLKRVGIHAGLPPLGHTVDKLYLETFKQVINRNKDYYNTYPEDKDRVRAIVLELEEHPYTFTLKPDETKHTVTGRTFLTMGRTLGGDGGALKIHKLVECMFTGLDNLKAGGRLSAETCETYLECLSFRLNERPLYGVMHESIYCSGPGIKSNWAAQRVAKDLGEELGKELGKKLGKELGDKFSWVNDGDLEKLKGHTGEFYFSGEMIYPFMLKYSGDTLCTFEQVANDLASKDDWPELYDMDQLEKTEIEARVMVYPDDMYVAWELTDWLPVKMEENMWKGFDKPVPTSEDRFKGYSHKSIKDAEKAAKVFHELFPQPGTTR